MQMFCFCCFVWIRTWSEFEKTKHLLSCCLFNFIGLLQFWLSFQKNIYFFWLCVDVSVNEFGVKMKLKYLSSSACGVIFHWKSCFNCLYFRFLYDTSISFIYTCISRTDRTAKSGIVFMLCASTFKNELFRKSFNNVALTLRDFMLARLKATVSITE